jgi:hypothetical protein
VLAGEPGEQLLAGLDDIGTAIAREVLARIAGSDADGAEAPSR